MARGGTVAPPLVHPLAPAATPAAEIVEGILPGGIAREGGVLRVDGEGFDRAGRLAFRLLKREPGSLQRNFNDVAQLVRFDADAHAGAFQRPAQPVDLGLDLLQPLGVRVFHLVPGGADALVVGFARDLVRELAGAVTGDAAGSQTLGDALGDDLTGRAQLSLDGLGLPHERFEHDVFLALGVEEVAAEDLRGRLQLAVDAAVALLEACRVPRQVEVEEIEAPRLQVDALARRVGADQDAQRVLGRVGVEGLLHRLARSAVVTPVKTAIRSSARSVAAIASRRRFSR